MTDKRKALATLIECLGPNAYRDFRHEIEALSEPEIKDTELQQAIDTLNATMMHRDEWEAVQVLIRAAKSIIKDTKTDEKSIIKDTELEAAIAYLEPMSVSMTSSEFRKHIKTLINAANPVKKWTLKEIIDIAYGNNFNVGDGDGQTIRTAVHALIQAGVINVKEG